MEKIGLVGAGVMGMTAARNILQGASSLSVYEVSPAALEQVKSMGASGAESPRTMAEAGNVVLPRCPLQGRAVSSRFRAPVGE